jgi:carboxylesterase
MESPARRLADADAGASRFGESRFGPSRFGPARGGTWLDDGRRDASGHLTGWYRPAEGDGRPTELTVLRPGAGAPPAPAPGLRAEKPAGPTALNLPGGRHGVLLFHGLSSTPLELQFLGRGLHRAGYSVRIAVIEGYSHGLPSRSPSGHREWAAAALAEFDRMRQQCDTLAVGGLCIGALLSLVVAAQRADAVSHVLALSTTLRYDGWAAPRSRVFLPLARLIPALGRLAVKEREPFGLKDERLRAWVAAQMKESGGSDAGAAVLRVRDLLQAQDLMRLVREGLARISAPTLLLHAREDEAASPRSAFEVASSISSKRVHCVILNDSYHMISIDKEKARVLSEMKDFLQAAAPAAEPGSKMTTAVMHPVPRSTEHARA